MSGRLQAWMVAAALALLLGIVGGMERRDAVELSRGGYGLIAQELRAEGWGRK